MFNPGDKIKIVRLKRGDSGSSFAMRNLGKTFRVHKVLSSQINEVLDYVTTDSNDSGVWFDEIEKVSQVYLSNQGTEINV